MRILALLLALMTCGASASTVNFYLTNFTATGLSNVITLIPQGPVTSGSTIISGLPIRITPANSVATTNLLTGTYQFLLQGLTFPKALYLVVPDNTNTYSAAELITNNISSSTSPSHVTPAQLVAATNLLQKNFATTNTPSTLTNIISSMASSGTATNATVTQAGTGLTDSWSGLTNTVAVGSSVYTAITNGFTVPTRLVFKGDSLTAGYDTNVPAWPVWLTNLYSTGANAIWATNAAAVGQAAINMPAGYATEIAPFAPASGTNAVYFHWAGINDTISTAAEVYAALSNSWRLARADGFKVAAFTVTAASSIDTDAVNRWRHVINRSIRQSDGWDYLIDVDKMFPDWRADRGDGIHFTTNASRIIAREVARVIGLPPRFASPPESMQPSFSSSFGSFSNVYAEKLSGSTIELLQDGPIGRTNTTADFYFSVTDGILGRSRSNILFALDSGSLSTSNIFGIKKQTQLFATGTELFRLNTDGNGWFLGSVTANAFLGNATGATNFWGQLSPTNYNSGTSASESTFLRGDGTWAAPTGGGDVTTAQLQSSTNIILQTATNSAKSYADAAFATGAQVTSSTNLILQSATNSAKSYADATFLALSQTNSLAAGITNLAKSYGDATFVPQSTTNALLVAANAYTDAGTNAAVTSATNSAKSYADATFLALSQTNTFAAGITNQAKAYADSIVGGGSATNAVSQIQTNGVTLGTGITNLNIVAGANTTVTGAVSAGSVTIGVSATAGGGGGGATLESQRQAVIIWEEFWGKPSTATLLGPFAFNIIVNSGLVSQWIGETTAPGMLQFSTSTSASAAPTLRQYGDTEGRLRFTAGTFTNEWRVRFPTLPTEAENYISRIGLLKSSNATEPTDGVFFLLGYTNAQMVCMARNNNSLTAATNTTTISANTWYRLRVVVNADGSAATFTVNDADAVVLESNIPASTRSVEVEAQLIKQVGTTARTMDVDYVGLGYGLTTSR